jgi:hypothetical protein
MRSYNKGLRGEDLVCSVKLDPYIKSFLDEGKIFVDKNWDFINGVVGEEGDGKTTFTLINAYYQDPTLNLSRCCFNAGQFELAVDNAKPGQSIIWDEADELSSHWASEVVQTIKRKLKRIRSYRLNIWLVTPTFFDLGKYFSISRMRNLFHIHSKEFDRGYWRLFNKNQKKKLYFLGKKYEDMWATIPTYYGRFSALPDNFPIDMNEYDNKKDEATRAVLLKSKNPLVLMADMRKEFVLNLYLFARNKGWHLTQSDLGRLMDLNRATISGYFQEFKENGKL